MYAMTVQEIAQRLHELPQPFSVRENEKFPYAENTEDFCTMNLAVYKGSTLILVVSEASEDNEGELQRDMFRLCNDAYYYVLCYPDRTVLKEKPLLRLLEPTPKFYFRGQPSVNDLLRAAEKKMTLDKLVNVILRFDKAWFERVPVKDFCDKVDKQSERFSCSPSIKEFTEELRKKKEALEFTNDECWLHQQYEDKLMQSILGKVEPGSLFRYTTARTLDFLFIQEEHSHNMCSLITMNDPSEVDYATKYLNDARLECHYGSFDLAVNTFITSLSRNEDDLPMWRMYGDNAKGICLEYDQALCDSMKDYFLLANVSYSQSKHCHHELDFVKALLDIKIDGRSFRLHRWELWQHFFKSYEYRIEKEVRLLIVADALERDVFGYKTKWITTDDGITAPMLLLPMAQKGSRLFFPLKIKGLKTGCKFPHREINLWLLQSRIDEIKEGHEQLDEFQKVQESGIDNYR